jgi:hypothetical protein
MLRRRDLGGLGKRFLSRVWPSTLANGTVMRLHDLRLILRWLGDFVDVDGERGDGKLGRYERMLRFGDRRPY